MLHIITLLAMASAVALSIYLVYVLYEEEFLFVTNNDGLVSRQPIHTNYDVETAKFYGIKSMLTDYLIFSGGGGNDKGSAATNSVMHASTDGDRGEQTSLSHNSSVNPTAEGTGSSVAGSSLGSISSSSTRLESAIVAPRDRAVVNASAGRGLIPP
ncbi:hypothetical protein Tco_0958075 [Tanacetum coccineum]